MTNDVTKREEFLKLVHEATCERAATYGQPLSIFDKHATILSALGYTRGDQPIEPHDSAIMLIALKLARAVNSPKHVDNWVDIAGYAACAYEVTQ